MTRYRSAIRTRAALVASTVVLGAALLGAAVMGTALAAPTPAQLDAEARSDIERIERYLNDLTTMESRFVQISDQGVAEGQVLIRRPRNMRIDYDPPVPILMVAGRSVVMYHDRELKQTSYVPVSETPLAFLLRNQVRIDEELTITDFRRGAQALELTVVQTDAPERGSLTLTFEDTPLRLAKWRVVDAQGNIVDIALLNPRFGVEIDSGLFSTVDPNLGYN